ncbi:MAG TPA: DUF169 domain-containing protein [Alphaproteobacteria bacterium]|nr:DUF169 domain-containing protein [Alphaproteobacteria bacterium]
MKGWQDLGKELNLYLKLETLPIAVKLLQSKNEIPVGTRAPLKDLKVRMAHCQVQAIVRKYGWTIAMTKEDLGCALSGHTYGWEQADKAGAIRFLKKMSYAADGEAADVMLQSFRTLSPGQYEAVVYSPLERTKIEPDIILMYLNPAQLMRCLHGSTHHSGQPITCSFSGRAASCTEGVIGAFLDQSPKIVVPGNGDRVWATVQDHEMIYALPASHLKDLVAGLAKTHERGIRYPIATFLRYQPEVGLTLPLTDIFKS